MSEEVTPPEEVEAVPVSNGRNGKGQFIKGGPPGPGNPFARAVHALRVKLYAAVGTDELGEVIEAMLDKARGGDVGAAKLITELVLGKPVALDVPVGDVVKMLLEGQRSESAPQKRYLWATPPPELLAPPEPTQDAGSSE